MSEVDAGTLRCPRCLAACRYEGSTRAGLAWRGALTCTGCGGTWPVARGLPRLLQEEQVGRSDRFMRRIYDSAPRLHDPMVAWTLPLFDAEMHEPGSRYRFVQRLELDALTADTASPARVLEVGVGTGSNLPVIRELLPAAVAAEIWGVDLSRGMLRVCAQRVRRGRAGYHGPVRLLLADAHHLPFAAGVFDRVLHVGGINAFSDPARALAEMARVARPTSPVVVVDEELDPERRHGLRHRLAFRAMTFYDEDPHCPLEAVPAGAQAARRTPLGRYFYCLSFRTAAAP